MMQSDLDEAFDAAFELQQHFVCACSVHFVRGGTWCADIGYVCESTMGIRQLCTHWHQITVVWSARQACSPLVT